jgi:exodeoxyribonuclease V gamma subunit
MIRLTYSNRTEGLLEALAADLDEARAAPGAGLLDPAVLVVPNRNVELYLRQGLARVRGIATNLEVHQLRRFVGRLAERALDGARLADADTVRGLLLSVLLDDGRLAGEDLAPVRAWLAAGGESPRAVDGRRVQLSGQLSRLFEEYSFSRPELLAAWPAGPALAGGPFAEVEAWERRLWLELFGPGGLVERREGKTGERIVLHAALLERLRDPAVEVPPRVHLFGISYVANLFQRILAGLAHRAEVHVYTVNPCLEFWEDVETFREVRRRLPRRGERVGAAALTAQAHAENPDPFGLADPADTPALVSWGRPGRENVRLLNELSDCDFRAAFRDPGGETLLARLQRDILFREPERTEPDPAVTADGSIRVLAVPGVRREAEVIAQEIWRLVREDREHPPADREPLRFHDIAVLVAGSDPQATFTQLADAFRENHQIPFGRADAKLAGESRIAEAVGLLLALPDSKFLRRDLLALLTHPAVAGRFPEVDPRQWIEWCDALGVVHGADRHDHRGTYLERDILNWDQGLRRLALGAFLSGERSGDDRLFPTGGERYLPEEPGAGGEASAAAFTLLARSLLADARFARNARLSLPDWADFLVHLVRAYVVGSGEEAVDLERCLRVLADLAEVDVDGRTVSWTVARELATEALAGLGGGNRGYLTAGVSIAGLQPMRAIPFRVIFVAGLNEGRFPAGDRKNQLDLRLAMPRAGDVSPREGDRYLFLETLLSAREKLYLSYVSRDSLTGEDLEPSSVVSELLNMLRGYLGSRAEELLVERHPLRRHDPRYFPALFGGKGGADAPAAPQARREAQIAALRQDLVARLGDRPITVRFLQAALKDSFAPLGKRLEVVAKPEPATTAKPDTVRVSLAAIRRFLECPLQGGAAYLLRLEEAEEGDLLATEDEPFAIPRREVGTHLRSWFLEAFADAGRIPDDEVLVRRAGERAERLMLAGRGPAGVFAEAERPALEETLTTWSKSLRELDPEARAPEVIRFGPGEEHARADRLEDPIVLEVEGPNGPVQVEVVGRTEPLLAGASLTLVRRSPRRTKEWEAIRRSRESIRGFLDHVALAAAGIHEGEHRVLVANGFPGANGVAPFTFAPLAAGEAREWLALVVADMLRIHPYFLPCEVAFYLRLHGGSVAEAVEKVREGERSHASAYGPVTHPERYEIPDEAEAHESLGRRFGLYFHLLPPPADEGKGKKRKGGTA